MMRTRSVICPKCFGCALVGDCGVDDRVRDRAMAHEGLKRAGIDPTSRHRHYDRPGYGSYGYYRGYDRGCRTVTIERDDGSVRRIRRCG